MKSVGIRQAKAHLSALVRAAAAGEPTLITDYGKPIAMIASAVEDLAHEQAALTPIEGRKPRAGAAAFRNALFDAPHPLELDFRRNENGEVSMTTWLIDTALFKIVGSRKAMNVRN